MSKNISDQIVDMLVEAGIKRIYAVTGDSLNHLNDAVRRNDQIEWIHVRHEEVGAYAATAEAELDGLACCAGSSGPGHVHLINGVYDANRSHVPLLVIASTMPSYEYGTDYFQETNTIKLFDDCSVYNQIIMTPKQAPRMVQNAIQHAISKKGAAVIGLPGDISELPAEDNITSTQIFKTNPIIRPNDYELNELASLINSNQKITVFCGIGAENAHQEIVALSQKLHAPVGYSFRGKMSTQHDNPNEVGMTGLLGLPSAYHSMFESDLLILLGTDFPYTDFIPTDKKIVQIDLNPERLGRRAQVDLGLCGDIKNTIDALLPLITQKVDNSFLESQLKIYEKVKESLLTYVKNTGDTKNIQPEYLAHSICNIASDDAIFTLDTGMTNVWGARFIKSTGKRKMLGSFNHGSMANAMPMAIGAALAKPNRQVIALCGDGGISMLLGDLATIHQYKLPIKIIIFNNRSLGMVKLEMQVAGLIDYQTEMVNPDFAKIGEAMGIVSENVIEPTEVEAALQRAFHFNGPYLLNVFTNENALAMPPKIEMNQVIGMTKSMTKLMLGGKMDDVWDTIKSNYKHLF